LLTWLLAGKADLGALLRRLGIWRVPFGWYIVAIFLQPAVFFAARWIDSLLEISYTLVSPLVSISQPLAFVIPILIVSAFPGSFAEELGWRGFALPALQSKTSALVASAFLALAWGHLAYPSPGVFWRNAAFGMNYCSRQLHSQCDPVYLDVQQHQGKSSAGHVVACRTAACQQFFRVNSQYDR
jgi:membrane protease YdiL (CAAX protease family)